MEIILDGETLGKGVSSNRFFFDKGTIQLYYTKYKWSSTQENHIDYSVGLGLGMKDTYVDSTLEGVLDGETR